MMLIYQESKAPKVESASQVTWPCAESWRLFLCSEKEHVVSSCSMMKTGYMPTHTLVSMKNSFLPGSLLKL